MRVIELDPQAEKGRERERARRRGRGRRGKEREAGREEGKERKGRERGERGEREGGKPNSGLDMGFETSLFNQCNLFKLCCSILIIHSNI